jgi:hypothetical protein
VLKKYIMDLELLISTPEASPKSSKIILKYFSYFTMGFPWSRVSSMNYWCVEVGQFSKGLMPFISPTAVVLFILFLIPSIIRMKRKGENGSTCLMPLDGQKGLAGAPLISSE